VTGVFYFIAEPSSTRLLSISLTLFQKPMQVEQLELCTNKNHDSGSLSVAQGLPASRRRRMAKTLGKYQKSPTPQNHVVVLCLLHARLILRDSGNIYKTTDVVLGAFFLLSNPGCLHPLRGFDTLGYRRKTALAVFVCALSKCSNFISTILFFYLNTSVGRIPCQGFGD
jgi:hypothetical protein